MKKFTKYLTIKNVIYLVAALVLTFITFSNQISSPTSPNTTPLTPTPTLSSTPSNQPIFTKEEPYNNDEEYNKAYEESLKDYEKENGKQDIALKRIRTILPIKQPLFTISSYDYSNNTYTVNLIKPYDQAKKALELWFFDQGINHPEYFRVKFVEN